MTARGLISAITHSQEQLINCLLQETKQENLSNDDNNNNNNNNKIENVETSTKKNVSVYIGFDPTAKSLHIGNLFTNNGIETFLSFTYHQSNYCSR